MDFMPRFRVSREFIVEAIAKIKQLTSGKKILSAVSGGVDSVVATALVEKAVGPNLRSVFLDTGLVREKDIQIVQRLPFPVEVLEAGDLFFGALKGVTDPIEKRILFREVFWERLAKEMGKNQRSCLVLGTNRADVQEVEKGQEQHNLPKGIDLEELGIKTLVEPLRGIFKNQIREVAQVLGLPKELYSRMPFPGPGFAIRIKGEVTLEKVRILKPANAIVEEELAPLNPFQAFAVLFQDEAMMERSGKNVMGKIVGVRAVESVDSIRATPLNISYALRQRITRGILQEVPEVGRVVFDETPKPPAKIELE